MGGVPLRLAGAGSGDRPPGEPRLVGYLYLLPAFAVFACFVLYPLYRAAYIDFLTDANAAKVLVDTNNLPAMKDAPAPSGGVSADVATAWQKLNEADGVIPYLDYTTPTFYDDISAAIQELLGGKQSPTEFTAGVQKAYDKWAESR